MKRRTSDRRRFLRAAGVTGVAALAGCTGGTSSGDDPDAGGTATDTPTATATSTGTATATSTPADAGERSFDLGVRGYAPDTEYHAVTAGTNGVKGEKADPSDEVTVSETTRFLGTVGEGEYDTYRFDDKLQLLSTDAGHAGFTVEGPLEQDLTGALNVEGHGLYYVVVTGEIRPAKNVEEGEVNVRDNVVSGVLTKERDQFEATGRIAYAALQAEADNSVFLRHSFGQA